MITIDKLYHKLGMKKLYHFLDPIVIKSSEFIFPKYSISHFYRLTDLPVVPNRDIGYYKFLDKPLVITIDEYKNPLGSLKYNRAKLKSYFKQKKKDSPNFIFKRIGTTKLNMRANQLLIYNYGLLTPSYKYNINVLNRYYKWYNRLSTIVDTINETKSTELLHFIPITLPALIPNRQLFVKYSDNINKTTLDKFTSDSELNILEFWRLLNPTYRKDTILGKIKDDKLKKVYLILETKDGVVLLSLYLLLSIVDEYSEKTKLKKYPYEKVQKLFYIFLTKLPLANGLTVNEVDDFKNSLEDKYINNKGKSVTDRFIDINTDDIDSNKIELDDHIEEDSILDNKDDIPIEDIGEIEESNEVYDEIDIEYNSIEDIYNEDTDNRTKLLNNVLEQNANNTLSNKEADKFISILDKQDELPDPYKTGLKLKDVKTIPKDDLDIKENEYKIKDDIKVIDKSMLSKKIEVFNNKYIDKVLKKDIVNSIYSLQNSNVVIEDYNINVTESILGKEEEHILKIKPIDGKVSTVRFKLPSIEKDGTFKMSGHTYVMRKFRSNVPIKKLDSDKVALTSYYGKIFITKAKYKKDNLSFYIVKELLSKATIDKNLQNITRQDITYPDVKLPRNYTLFSKNIKSFLYKNRFYYFGYLDREKILKNEKIKDIEKDKYVLIGKQGSSYLVMDQDGKVFKYKDNKYIEDIDIFNLLDIDLNNGPLEFSSIKIFKKEFPVGLLLSYYIGFDNLIKLLNANVTIIDSNKRYKAEPDEYIIKFIDKKYIIKKDNSETTMILAGIYSLNKYLKSLSVSVLNSKQAMLSLFNLLDLQILYINEIKLLDNMFVDDITKSILKEMKEPLTFKGLLIRSSELLLTDDYKHPNNIEGSLIKGYERVAGMIYNELVKSLRDYNNRSMYGKTSVQLDPYIIWKNIGNDSTTILVNDLNPISSLKLKEDVTYSGMLGLTSQTLSKSVREVHPSEIGTISEATKDSGDVGLTAYLTANPNLISLRGMVKPYPEKDNYSGLLSTVGVLTPGTTNDISKRSNFSNIQHSHIVPTEALEAPVVRTGYEYVLGSRVDDKFIVVADQDGVVVSVTSDYITVEYKDKSKNKYSLGKWHTKEESNSAYIHKVITPLNKGDRFKEGEVLTYDNTFFELDIFNKKQAVYKNAKQMTVAFVEDANNDEDASIMSKKAGDSMVSNLYKVKSYKLLSTDNIVDMIKIGDKTENKTVIFTTMDDTLGNIDNFDKESIEILQKIKKNNPTAKIRGKVENIVFYYNDDLENINPSMRKYIEESDKRLANKYGKHINGRVTSQYSIKGKPLLPGEIELKVYISYKDGMGVGDKGIIGNQLKTTISVIYDYPIYTEDGREVDIVFSWKALTARTVLSPLIIGTTTTLLDKIGRDAVDIYFG